MLQFHNLTLHVKNGRLPSRNVILSRNCFLKMFTDTWKRTRLCCYRFMLLSS